MLNLAGSSYDFGNVLFAVLQECEHQRRALLPNEAAGRLREIARAKLAEIRASYEECGGTEGYWNDLEREVLETTLPQYVPAAVEQNRLEKNNYDLWRQADPISRAAFGLLGLAIGGIIIAIPWIPIFEDAFAFALAAAGFLYPEIKKTVFDYRHARLLNRLIVEAEKYQGNSKIHYVSEAQLQADLDEIGSPERSPKAGTTGKVLDHPAAPRERERA